MLAITKKLWTEKFVGQYWQLIKILFFNFKVVGYILISFFILAGILCLAGFISTPFKAIGLIIAFLTLFIFFFVGVIILPMGMLSLMTNKHAYTLPQIGKKLFFIACLFCIFCSVFIAYVMHGVNEEKHSTVSVFSVLLLGALYFWLAIYLMSKRFYLFGLAPLILIGGVKFYSNVGPGLHPTILPLASVLAWILFYRWWLSFRPGRWGVKSIFIETDLKKIQVQLPLEKLFYSSSGLIRTPIGSLLLGYSDSFLILVKRLLITYSATFLFAILMCGGKNGDFNENMFMVVCIALAYAILLSGIDLFNQRMLINIKRCWLAFSGNRRDFFQYIEQYFLRGLGVLVLFNVGIICMLIEFSGYTQYFLYCMGGIVLLATMLIMNFYINIYFYKRAKLNPGSFDLFKLLISLACFIPPIVYLVQKYGRPDGFGVLDMVVIGLVLLFFASLQMIRMQCIKQWQKTDF